MPGSMYWNTCRENAPAAPMKAAERLMAASLTRNGFTPTARAASSSSRTACRQAPKRPLRSPQVAGARSELQVAGRFAQRQHQADATAGEGNRERDDARHLGEGQRDE